MTPKYVIGNGNEIPWRLPDDLRNFKDLTIGNPVIMGRNTFASIGYRRLPDRTNIIMSHNLHSSVANMMYSCGVYRARSAAEALKIAEDSPSRTDEIFVIGGESVYNIFLPWADKLYVTLVLAYDIDGDKHFPTIDDAVWDWKMQSIHQIDEQHRYGFMTFLCTRKHVQNEITLENCLKV